MIGQNIEGLEAKVLRLERNEAALRVINQFAVDLIQTRSVEDLVWHVAREVVGKLDFLDCVIYLLDHKTQHLVQYAAMGDKDHGGKSINNALLIPFGEGITGAVAKTGKPLIIGDLSKDARYMVDLKPMQSEICVPLIFEDEIFGVIDCEDARLDYFDAFHLDILTTIASITSAKLAQIEISERFDLMVQTIEQVSEGILIVDKQGAIIECNQAVTAISGYEREEIKSKKFGNLAVTSGDISPLLTGGYLEGESRGEMEIICKDGQHKMLELSMTHLRDEHQQAFGIIVARDISVRVAADDEAKLKNRELLGALKSAEKARHAQITFLANASHELRTPLNAVVGFSEMLKTYVDIQSDAEVALEYSSYIHEAGKHLTQIVNDLLSISTLDSGASEPTKTEFCPRMKILECVHILEHKAATKGSSIDFSVLGDAYKIDFDPVHFKQIIINLIDNAIKYSPSETTIKVDCRYSPNNGVKVEVEDNGCGIAAERLDTIFEPFAREADVVIKEIDGVGLGLTLSRRLARVNGGDIVVTSKLGEGSIFTLKTQ